MKKLQSIQGIRGIAVVLVLLSHLIRVEEKYSSLPLLPDFLVGGISGVDVFFVISGFIMVMVTRGQFESLANIGRFLYHRVTRIYPVYWFYAALALGIFVINPSWINHGETGSILDSFLLIPQQEPNIPLLAVSWTLSYELYFYVVFALLLAFPERYLAIGLALWGVVLITGSWIHPVDPIIALMLSPLTVEFIAGAAIAKLVNRLSLAWAKAQPGKILSVVGAGFAKKSYMVGSVLSICSMILANQFYTHTYHMQPNGVSRVILFGLPACIAVYGFVQAERLGSLLPQWLVHIGNASYSIYLSHVLILSALGRLLFRPSFGLIQNTSVLLILIAASIACGILSYQIIEKRMLNWFRNRVNPPVIEPRVIHIRG